MMSSEEVLRLRSTNNELMKENGKLLQMMDILEKFRAMFISMVNNCKCNTELQIRTEFNLLMEEYYDIKDNKEFDNKNTISNRFKNINNNNFNNLRKFGVRKVYSFQSDQQINDNKSNDNFIENSLGTDPDFNQTEDNINSEENNNRINEIISNEDINDNNNNGLVQRQSAVKTKTDLNLTENTKRVVKKKRKKPNRDRRFPCSWPGCDSIFKAKVDMTNHMSRHTGVKPLSCDWPACEFRTAFHSALKIHKLKHTGEKPFKCSWPSCEWMFRSSDQMKRHMKKHTGERPFSCEFDGCDRRYTSRQAMRYHLERAHKI